MSLRRRPARRKRATPAQRAQVAPIRDFQALTLPQRAIAGVTARTYDASHFRNRQAIPMKILIVDDHPLFRAGFHAVLQQGALDATVLSVSSVPEALQILQRDPEVGLVLLDVHLKGDDGFGALRIIGEQFATTACIMISGDDQEGMAARAVAAGASGFIPKSFTADEMVDAIQQVLAGDVFVPASTTVHAPATAPAALTLRQLEVITMLGRGCSNKEIARALDVAERTVKAHVSAVFEALNVRNRTQAVLVAQRRGFLPATSAYGVTH